MLNAEACSNCIGLTWFSVGSLVWLYQSSQSIASSAVQLRCSIQCDCLSCSRNESSDKCVLFGLHHLAGRLIFQRAHRTSSHACRFAPSFYPIGTQLAFLQLSAVVVPRHAERTGHGAAVTPNTNALVDKNRARFGVPPDSAGRAAHQTWTVMAMHTARRNVGDAYIGVAAAFHLNDATPCRLPFNIDVVVIEAGYRARPTPAAKIDVQREYFFHVRSFLFPLRLFQSCKATICSRGIQREDQGNPLQSFD